MKEKVRMGIGWELNAAEIYQKPKIVAVILDGEEHMMDVGELEDFVFDALRVQEIKDMKLRRWQR